jgi:hypothetical protein
LHEPLTKDETVQRTENQTLGATRCAWNDTDVLRPQTVFANVVQGFGACVDVKGLHGSIVPVQNKPLRPCLFFIADRKRDGFPVGDRSYRGDLGVYFFNPCSFAKALAMAEPAPAAGGEV